MVEPEEPEELCQTVAEDVPAAAEDVPVVHSPAVVRLGLVRSSGIVGAALVYNPGVVRVHGPGVVRQAPARNPRVVRVHRPYVVRQAPASNPQVVRVHGPEVVSQAPVQSPDAVGPVGANARGIASPIPIYTPGAPVPALVYRPRGLGWDFTIYEDPVDQEEVVEEEWGSSSRGEAPWRRR